MAYVLDADAFISSNERHYPVFLCPGYWDWIRYAHDELGLVHSVEAIKGELLRQEDDVSDWALSMPDTFFVAPSLIDVNAFSSLAYWAEFEPQYAEAAKAEFLNSGEFELIAHAMSHNHVVVTYEKSRPNSKAKIKAPEACRAVQVECITPFEMLKRESVRFEFRH